MTVIPAKGDLCIIVVPAKAGIQGGGGAAPMSRWPRKAGTETHEEPAIPTHKRLFFAWFFVPVHRLLLRLSRGRILGRLEGHGILILVTRGRRSGKPRSSPLMYFRFDDSDDLIVVASNYGQDRHPAWYLNVAADPGVTVETGGERFAAEARVTRGRERDALLDKVVASNPRFGTYRAATHRRIPVVALRRAR